MDIQTIPLAPRVLRATEARLQSVYDAARLGLQGDKLAMAAGMLPVEYYRLRQLDPLVEMAELKGRADAEQQLARVLHDAALAGDAKVALDLLKHKHSWVSTQHVQVNVEQQISITAALQEAERRVISGDRIDEAPRRANVSGLLTNTSTSEVESGYRNSDTTAASYAAELQP